MLKTLFTLNTRPSINNTPNQKQRVFQYRYSPQTINNTNLLSIPPAQASSLPRYIFMDFLLIIYNKFDVHWLFSHMQGLLPRIIQNIIREAAALDPRTPLNPLLKILQDRLQRLYPRHPKDLG